MKLVGDLGRVERVGPAVPAGEVETSVSDRRVPTNGVRRWEAPNRLAGRQVNGVHGSILP